MQLPFIESCFHAFKDQSALVHNLTNDVAHNTVANVLLACRASPAMVHDIQEAPDFVCLSDALAINIGTLTQTRLNSMLATAKMAHSKGIPWVLDPVAVGATAFRQQACRQLLSLQPDVIRGNASEILALAGMSSQSRGIDSGDSVAAAHAAAEALTQYAKVVVVTGEIDWVTDGMNRWAINHGHPMMTQVTAIGCALTALIAGFVGANKKAMAQAAVTALCYYGQAAEHAMQIAQGPGSFYIHFLDSLYALQATDVSQQARVTFYE